MTTDNHSLAVKIRDAMCYRYPSLAVFEAPVVVAAIEQILNEHNVTATHSSKFDAAWSEWKAYRKERKEKPYTPRGETAQLSRIMAWGEDRAIAAILFSVAQGYQGIFEEGAPSGAGFGRKSTFA